MGPIRRPGLRFGELLSLHSESGCNSGVGQDVLPRDPTECHAWFQGTCRRARKGFSELQSVGSGFRVQGINPKAQPELEACRRGPVSGEREPFCRPSSLAFRTLRESPDAELNRLGESRCSDLSLHLDPQFPNFGSEHCRFR